MNNFKYIKNNEINREKWDNCISGSINPRIYGLSWYLDLVCKNWDGIVFGDYEVVFPVIFKNLFFFKKSYQPLFCQQLGFFYKNKNLINDNSIKLCYDNIFRKKFKKFIFHSTSEFAVEFKKHSLINLIRDCNISFLNNFEIDLSLSYSDLKSRYNTNTLRNLKKSKQFNLRIINKINVDVFMNLYKTNKKIRRSIQKNFLFKDQNYLIIKKIITTCLNKKKGQLVGVCNHGNNVISAAFFLSSYKRKIMLFNVTEPNYKQYHAMTFLIDNFIKSNCENEVLLDFEGSNIEGVKNFYSGFGSVNKPYYLIKTNSIF